MQPSVDEYLNILWQTEFMHVRHSCLALCSKDKVPAVCKVCPHCNTRPWILQYARLQLRCSTATNTRLHSDILVNRYPCTIYSQVWACPTCAKTVIIDITCFLSWHRSNHLNFPDFDALETASTASSSAYSSKSESLSPTVGSVTELSDAGSIDSFLEYDIGVKKQVCAK